jgi:hypothetical protein
MRTLSGLHIPVPVSEQGRIARFKGGARYLPYLIGGAAGQEGYHAAADLALADNVQLRDVVAEIDAALAEYNTRRQEVLQRLVFETTEHAVRVRQAGNTILFERGSEFGTPGFQRTQRASYTTGLPIKSYKVGTGWSIEYLADATSNELRQELADYVAADNTLLYQLALQTLFDNLAGTTYTFADRKFGDLVVRAPLLNGDGMVPPPFEGTAFAGSHDHYFVSGGASLTDANVVTLNTALDEHGHRSNKVLFVHQDQVDDVFALTDFYAPPDPNIVDPTVAFSRVGAPFLGVIRGLDLKVRKWNLIPSGYVFAMNDYGPNSNQNPVARREFPAGHPLQGLKLFRPNPETIYPVEQTFYQRWIGFGSNQRTNGALMKLTAGGYTVPTILTLKEE